MKKDTKGSILAATIFGGAVALAAVAGSTVGPADPEIGRWYRSLEKSPLNPPNIVFPIAWTTLYALIAWSGWRIWRNGDDSAKKGALALWGTQLALNAVWNPIFFGARSPEIAMADLVALFAVIVAYTKSASKIDKPAAAAMAPYLGWVAFAGLLNAEIIRRN